MSSYLQRVIKLTKLVTDVKAYADLLNSVGQQGLGAGRKRPLSPVQCAEYIQRLISEEGESLDKIAERLNLGKPQNTSNPYKPRNTSQITSFLNLLKVSPISRELAGWSTDESHISFSTIAQLSTMTTEEQDLIIQSILKSKDKKRTLNKEDVKKIKKWRNENPDLSITECIEKVLQLKPVTVVTHVIVVEVYDKLRRFIASNSDYEEKLLNILHNNLKGKFHNIDTGNSVMTISMDEEAYKIFFEHQYKKNSSYTKFLYSVLESRIE